MITGYLLCFCKNYSGCCRYKMVLSMILLCEPLQAGRTFHRNLPHSFSAKFSFSCYGNLDCLLITHPFHQFFHRHIGSQRLRLRWHLLHNWYRYSCRTHYRICHLSCTRYPANRISIGLCFLIKLFHHLLPRSCLRRK